MVPPSMTLVVYTAGAEGLSEYDVIGKHVRGDFLSRFTKMSDFERNRLELLSQQCTVGEPEEWPEPDQSWQGPSSSQSQNTSPTAAEAVAPVQEDASSLEVGHSVPKRERYVTTGSPRITRGAGSNVIYHPTLESRDPRVDGYRVPHVPMDNRCMVIDLTEEPPVVHPQPDSPRAPLPQGSSTAEPVELQTTGGEEEEADDATRAEPSTAEPEAPPIASVLMLENTPSTSSQPGESADKHAERLARDKLFIGQIHDLIYGTVKRRPPETAIPGLPPLADPLTEAVTELVRMGDVVRLSRQTLDLSLHGFETPLKRMVEMEMESRRKIAKATKYNQNCMTEINQLRKALEDAKVVESGLRMQQTAAESSYNIATAVATNAKNEVESLKKTISSLQLNLQSVKEEAEKNDQLSKADVEKNARDVDDQYNKRGEIYSELQALKAKYEKPKGDDGEEEEDEDEESSQGGEDTDTSPRKRREDEEEDPEGAAGTPPASKAVPEAGGTSAMPPRPPRRSASPPGNQPQGESTAHSRATVAQHVAVVIEAAQERSAPEPHVEEGRAGQEGVGENVAPEGFVSHRIEVSESSTGEEGDLHSTPTSLRARQLPIAHGESAPQGTVGDSQVITSQTVAEEPLTMTVPEGVTVLKPGPLREARYVVRRIKGQTLTPVPIEERRRLVEEVGLTRLVHNLLVSLHARGVLSGVPQNIPDYQVTGRVWRKRMIAPEMQQVEGLQSFQFSQSPTPNYPITAIPSAPPQFSRFPQYLAQVLGNDHGSSDNPKTITAAYLFQSIRPDYPPDAFLTEALAQEYTRRGANSAWFPFLPRPTMTKALLEGVNNFLGEMRQSIRPTNLEEVYLFDLSTFRAHAILEWQVEPRTVGRIPTIAPRPQDPTEEGEESTIHPCLGLGRVGCLYVTPRTAEAVEDAEDENSDSDEDEADVFDDPDVVMPDAVAGPSAVSTESNQRFSVRYLPEGTDMKPDPTEIISNAPTVISFDIATDYHFCFYQDNNLVVPTDFLIHWLATGRRDKEAPWVAAHDMANTGATGKLDAVPVYLKDLDLQVPRREVISHCWYGHYPHAFPIIPGDWENRKTTWESLRAFGKAHQSTKDPVVFRAAMYCMILSRVIRQRKLDHGLDPNGILEDPTVDELLVTAHWHGGRLLRVIELAVVDGFL
ncbi:hypothetical protein R1sor_024371 [Riccia sorocarpa]|uniref:Uncharacterized protein n=1 Tax=Riccia sorocarpa TaxID=122646 RepID=A0ABD3GTK2_9MARC